MFITKMASRVRTTFDQAKTKVKVVVEKTIDTVSKSPAKAALIGAVLSILAILATNALVGTQSIVRGVAASCAVATFGGILIAWDNKKHAKDLADLVAYCNQDIDN